MSNDAVRLCQGEPDRGYLAFDTWLHSGYKETNFRIGNKIKNQVVSDLKTFSRFCDSLCKEMMFRFFSMLN